LTITELFNLEVQMMKDHETDPSELRRRDRKIGQQLESQKSNRRDLFLAWLKRVQAPGQPTPGQLFESGYRWLGRLLLLLGLISGGGTAASILSYDGSKPVNVVNFLAVIIGIQLIMIFFFLLNSLPKIIKKYIPGSGEFYNFIRELSYLFSRLMAKIFEHLLSNQLNKLWTDLQRLKAKQKLYHSVEKWLAVGLTQRFGLAFNIGALATCLYLISFSDLAFAWNTTLDISSKTFHQAVRAISLPWSGLIPEAVPSSELVEASRYFRLDSEYVNTPVETNIPKAVVVGGWWSFLVLSLVCYGLIPRLLIFITAKLKLKSALSKIPLHTADFESLYDRLTRPLFETRAFNQEQILTEVALSSDSKSWLRLKGENCTVIQWGDLKVDENDLTNLIQQRFGWTIKNRLTGGSLDYDGSNLRTIKFIENQKDSDPLLLLVESWEAPDAAITHFLNQLRNTISIDRHIVIGLINKNARQDWKSPLMLEYQIWKNKIAELADPYIRVEAMVESL
jgi:hypothetical protein